MEESDSEHVPNLSTQQRRDTLAGTFVYARRWYVLAVFATSSFTEAFVWNTWGPITESAEAVFDWNDGNVGMLSNYGNIAYIITVLPACWLLDVKGLRLSVIICSALVLLGTGLRCITLDRELATWFANICAVLNGMAGTVPWAGPALLSCTWFPAYQRTTATAIVSFFSYSGIAMSFIVGPQLVSHPEYTPTAPVNKTSDHLALPVIGFNEANTHKNITNMDTLQSDIRRLMYIHLGLAGTVFLLVLVTLPSKPPLPPSISAALQRVHYGKGLRRLVRNRALWLIVLAFAVPTGVLGVWASVLDVNIKHLVSQVDAGWMGFWQTMAGCIAGLLIARFSDIFMKRMKLYLIVLFIGAIASSACFTALRNNYIPFDKASLYATCILIGVFINGTIPLFYEISCEASYPVAEGVTGGFLTLGNNLSGIIFLFMLLIPDIGRSWMNWALLGSAVFALPLLFMFPERYRRTDMDMEHGIEPPTNAGENPESSLPEKAGETNAGCISIQNM